MSKVFIFDVDGTLTPSRLPMTKEFQEFFSEWVKKNKFYLVTGSDIEKLQEQMCYFDIEAEALFTCCGNEMWIPDPHIVNISAYRVYENKFEPPEDLIKFLEHELEINDYPFEKTGNHIENRGSMVNFSPVGRNCSLEQRKEFFEWDNQVLERQRIAEIIPKICPELEAVLGGQISIDIYPRGNDKSQILEHIKDRNIVTSKDDYVFLGDRTMEGGNDYPLAKLMEKTENCKFHQVEDYRKTWWYLQRYELGLEK